MRRRRRQTESRSRSREGDTSARGLFQEPYMRQLRIEDCRAVFRSNKAAIHASKPEIKIVCAQLSQALKAEALDSVVLDLLRRLSVYMHPLRGNRMLEYLRFTGAVPLVKAVRRDCGKEVSGFASRLLDSWRAVLVDLQKQQATDTASASKPNAELSAASSTSRAARQPQSDGKALLVSSSSSSSVSTSSDSESQHGVLLLDRRVEAQLESYRTRNAALEARAGTRPFPSFEIVPAELCLQAVKQGLDAEIERRWCMRVHVTPALGAPVLANVRLRRELQSKEL
ncbi:unnamed protein product [Symbiodinium sp. CCMP2592]|nr:unnamed protein product [Symbiodinium sp. CCMP2592]